MYYTTNRRSGQRKRLESVYKMCAGRLIFHPQQTRHQKVCRIFKKGLAFCPAVWYHNQADCGTNRIWTVSSAGRSSAWRAGGHRFESCPVHHTVRTRTRFFTKKGSGTFFVYRRFCGRTTQSIKRAKAGYHYDGGILPFVLRDQGRFVRTWSPSIWRIDGNCCVRAYREPVHLWQGVTH